MSQDDVIRKWAKSNGIAIAEDEPIPPAMIKEFNRTRGNSLIESLLMDATSEVIAPKVKSQPVNGKVKTPKEVPIKEDKKPEPKESEEEMRARITSEIRAKIRREVIAELTERPTLRETPNMTFTIVKGVGPWDLGPELGING